MLHVLNNQFLVAADARHWCWTGVADAQRFGISFAHMRCGSSPAAHKYGSDDALRVPEIVRNSLLGRSEPVLGLGS